MVKISNLLCASTSTLMFSDASWVYGPHLLASWCPLMWLRSILIGPCDIRYRVAERRLACGLLGSVIWVLFKCGKTNFLSQANCKVGLSLDCGSNEFRVYNVAYIPASLL